MKKWIFWSFDRGSFQYDVLCALILIAMFAIPPAVFNDRPDYMRISDSGIERVQDGDGNDVYTVKADRGVESGAAETAALERLQEFLQADGPPEVFRSEAVYTTRGGIAAYAFWLK
jgi:hypothetical protein